MKTSINMKDDYAEFLKTIRALAELKDCRSRACLSGFECLKI